MSKSSESSEKKKKKQRRIDPTFKEVITNRFAELDIKVETEVQVSYAPRAMDSFIRLATEEERERVRNETPFTHFLEDNQAEFKAINDPLDMWDCYRIQGRGYLYLADHKISPTKMTITIICAGEPRKVLHESRDIMTFKRVAAGCYRSAGPPDVYVIVINELPIIEKNYFLLIFASSKRKFRDFLTKSLSEDHYEYLNVAYKNRPQFTKEILKMMGITTIPEENLQFIAKDIGERLMPYLTPEARIKGLTPEERFIGLTSAEEKKLFEQLAKKYSVAQDNGA